ncbi:MAG: hypothetical protein ACOCVC_00720 [Spirochaeta sp.]
MKTPLLPARVTEGLISTDGSRIYLCLEIRWSQTEPGAAADVPDSTSNTRPEKPDIGFCNCI